MFSKYSNRTVLQCEQMTRITYDKCAPLSLPSPPPLPNVSRNRGLGFIFNDVEEMYNVPGHVVTEDMNKYIHTLQINHGCNNLCVLFDFLNDKYSLKTMQPVRQFQG